MKEKTKIIQNILYDPLTGSIFTPIIYQTSTYVQEVSGVHKGFDYPITNNPTLKIFDIELISKKIKRKNPTILVVVDNTFASPAIQNPLKLGSDIVIHSSTKYLSGYSDVLDGLITLKKTIFVVL